MPGNPHLSARIVLLALLAVCAAARPTQAADFNLCVRGTSLDEIRTAHLLLSVDGADIAAIAPRLGAELANHLFWQDGTEEVYGAPYDPEVCGDATASPLRLAISLTPEQGAAIAAALARGDTGALRAAVASLPAPATIVPAPVHHKDFNGTEPQVGEAVVDAEGKLRYHLMRIYYATDRRATADPAPQARFGGERGALSLGVVNVAVPRTHERGKLESPSVLKLEFSADPDKHVTLQSLTTLTPDRWRAEIAKRAVALGNPGILLFVHGYNTSFADAALRTAQVSFDLKFPGATVLFSWPSRSSLVEYTVDEQAAEWSVPDLQVVLASLATVAPGAPIYVIAHSMGNRVFTRAFKSLLEQDPSRSAPFRQLVLAAPDVDADVFRREIGPAILGKGPRVTLYASSNDKALAASRGVHGGYHRLGESGRDLVVLRGLDTVDASTVSTELLGHSYYQDSGTVMSDLVYLIRRSLTPEQREKFALQRVSDAALGLYWRFKPQQ
ncbi:MAG TPA: alpha/beta hydrolase [Steroidobacteraceae bacterium]|nr:alpha/beta hydrolase [Steroidobacteraceae bacterium]